MYNQLQLDKSKNIPSTSSQKNETLTIKTETDHLKNQRKRRKTKTYSTHPFKNQK